jgi:hypothetical protein
MNDRTVYRLSDETISQIVRLIQMGLLTGTDIVDHIRLMVVEPSTDKQGYLNPTPEYRVAFEESLNTLQDQLEVLKNGDGQEETVSEDD